MFENNTKPSVVTKIIMVSPEGDLSGLVGIFGTGYYESSNETASLLGHILSSNISLMEVAETIDDYKEKGYLREVGEMSVVDYTYDFSERADKASFDLFSTSGNLCHGQA